MRFSDECLISGLEMGGKPDQELRMQFHLSNRRFDLDVLQKVRNGED